MIHIGARSLARRVMPTLVRAGWSGSKIVRYITRKGWTYATAGMWGDVREFQNSFHYSRLVMNYIPNKTVPKSIMTQSTFDMSYKYQVVGEAKYRDPTTGRVSYHSKSLLTNRRMTKEEYGQEFIEWDRGTYPEREGVVLAFNVLEVKHQKGRLY